VKELNRLLDGDPNNLAYRVLKAAALAHVGEYEAAAAIYEKMLARIPVRPSSG